jgi:transcriptional accessory protein Tex/SPT6
LQIRKAQVEAVVQLLDDENTVPFITRYRKERTGGLNEELIRRIQERVVLLRELTNRKQTILKSIAGQGRLSDGLTQAILAAESPKRLEDLYLPFKPKKKSLATEAREKGLGPLAEAIWRGDSAVAKLDEVLPGVVDPDKWLLNVDDVLNGVKHILADLIADAADVRGPLRAYTWDTGLIVAV